MFRWVMCLMCLPYRVVTYYFVENDNKEKNKTERREKKRELKSLGLSHTNYAITELLIGSCIFLKEIKRNKIKEN